MLENINGVKIKGGRFTEETSLQDCLKRPFNIIYGTNGSGKSTLAKALHDYDREDRRDDFELEFIPDNNEVRSENVHVFNEDFINSRMKVTEDTGNNSLNTIVMFGEQIETNNSVEEINKQISELENEIQTQQAIRYIAPITFGSHTNGYYKVTRANLKRVEDEKYPIRIKFDVAEWIELNNPAKFGMPKWALRGVCKTREEFLEHCK